MYISHIIQRTPHKLSAGRKNRPGVKGPSAWPEDQRLHRRRRPGPPVSGGSSPSAFFFWKTRFFTLLDTHTYTSGAHTGTGRRCIGCTSFAPVPVFVDNAMLTPTGYPPPTQQPTWPTAHTASTAATPRYPQGRRQTPADAPTSLKRSMLTPFGGPRPRFGAKGT